MDTEKIADQSVMEALIRSNLHALGAVELLDLKILRHEPGKVFDRRVVLAKYELTLKKANGQIEKVVLRGSAGPDDKRLKAYHILQSLSEHGFNDTRYSVPRPVGYFPELHLLLYTNIPGLTLMERMEYGKNRLAEIMEGAIEWLIAFHTNKPRQILEARFNWEKEEEIFNRLVETICSKYADHCDRVKSIVEILVRQERKLLDEKTFTLVHGDFQPNNIIMTDAGISVIDFNDAFLFDELYDLAYFVTQGRFMLQRFSREPLDPLLEQVVEHYCVARKIPYDATTKKKLALFTAKSLLSIKALTTHEQGYQMLENIEAYAQKTI